MILRKRIRSIEKRHRAGQGSNHYLPTSARRGSGPAAETRRCDFQISPTRGTFDLILQYLHWKSTMIVRIRRQICQIYKLFRRNGQDRSLHWYSGSLRDCAYTATWSVIVKAHRPLSHLAVTAPPGGGALERCLHCDLVQNRRCGFALSVCFAVPVH